MEIMLLMLYFPSWISIKLWSKITQFVLWSAVFYIIKWCSLSC